MNRKQDWIVNAGFAVAVLILGLVAWSSYSNTRSIVTFDQKEINSRVRIRHLEELLSVLKDAETGQRGFIITGDKEYLEPYNQALKQVEGTLAALKSETADNPRQHETLNSIGPLVKEKLSELALTIQARQRSGFEAANQIVATGHGKEVMDQIRRFVAEARQGEESLLNGRVAAKEAGTRKAVSALLIGSLLAFGLLLIVFVLLKRQIYQRAKAEAELVVHRDHLQEIMEGRTRELKAANEHLQTEIEDHKRAKMALAESESRFRTMLDNISQLAWMADETGWIFWYNQRWYAYTGTTPKDMEGWGWQSVHDPAELPKVVERWRGSISTGQPFDMVFPLRGSDGVFRPFLTRVSPVRDTSGKIVRWFGTNTDITEQKRNEEALRRNQAQLETILENVAEGLVVSTLEGQLLVWNRAAQEMHGFSSLEECRRRLPEFTDTLELSTLDGDQISLEEWPMARVLRGESLRDWEARIRNTRQGWERIFNYSGSMARDADGRWLMAILVISDITEKKASTEVQARLAAIVESSEDAILSKDLQGTILRAYLSRPEALKEMSPKAKCNMAR